MKAEPIRNAILFAFLNEVGGDHREFKDQSKSGIILSTMMDTQTKGRWAKALLVGPECTAVKNGQYIFIKPLMWTQGFKFDGVQIWKTDGDQILAISDKLPEFQIG